jgi:drug/metabolite transporter (DMT)-like permease
MWVVLSIIGAFSQALGAGIKKKALQNSGLNNVIGFISFTMAGWVFGTIHWLQTGTLWPGPLPLRFWTSMSAYAGLNIVAVWFMYRALDLAEFNYLMPFMTLTSLSMIVPPIFFLGEVPSPAGLGGVALVVAGAMAMNWRKGCLHAHPELRAKNSDNRKGGLYFLVTALCFTFTPTATKGAIQASSVLFASFLVHVLVGLGFLALILWQGETERIGRLFRDRSSHNVIVAVMASGLLIVLENGSINAALATAPVAHVMAVKRLMPLFAFLIGFFYFHERTGLKQKLAATSLMIAGAVILTITL